HQAQRDAVALAVELQHADVQLVADVHHLARLAHALPGHVGDVQQAVDAAQVHDRAVASDVLDHALHDCALLEALTQLLPLDAVLVLGHRTAGDDDVVAIAVQLDDLELEFLALEVTRVAHRAHIHQGARQEGAHVADVDGEAALDLAGDAAGDDLASLHRGLQFVPDHGALGLLARQHGLAEAVLEVLEGDLHGVAGSHFDLAGLVTELFDRDDALGLQAGI